MVDSDEYLLQLAAYIHLNPLRAGIAKEPHSYRWSSHRAYIGKESIPWLETSFILSQFSDNLVKSRTSFASFVKELVPEGHRGDFHGENALDTRVLGDDKFLEVVLSEADSVPIQKPGLDTVIAAVKKLYQVTDEDLTAQSQQQHVAEARAVAAWATIELSGGTLTELASYLRRDLSTVSGAVRRLEKRKLKDPELLENMRRLKQELLRQ